LVAALDLGSSVVRHASSSLALGTKFYLICVRNIANETVRKNARVYGLYNLMKTEIIEVSSTKREIHIEVEADLIKKNFLRVAQKYSRSVQIPGFRKGFAPLDIVKMRFQAEIGNEVLRELLPTIISDTITESGLNPIGEPDVHLENQETVKLNGSEPITLHVHFEVFPTIEKVSYKGLEAVRRVRPVEETEVDEIISERLQQSASLIPVEGRKSEDGDTVIVDLSGVIEGEAEPITAEDLEIKLGDDNVEPSFAENLKGVEEDDVKAFTVEYAADFGSPALAGKKVEYTATVKSIGIVEVPKADNEWAKGLDEGFASLKDLRKKLRDDIELMAKMEADNKAKDELLQKLIEAHKIEVPTKLVDIQARNLLNNFAQDMMQRGVSPEAVNQDFMKIAYQSMSVQAENDVRGALLLDKVSTLEKVEVSADDVTNELEQMAGYYRATVEEIRQSLAKQGGDDSIADRIKNRKAIEVLFENAKISDGEWLDEVAMNAQALKAATEAEAKPKKAKATKKVEESSETSGEKPKSKAKKKS
jgi:trigger factor